MAVKSLRDSDRLLHTFEARVKKYGIEASERMAKVFIDRLKTNIRKELLPVVPLSKKTLSARRSRGNMSRRPLYDTKQYINAITRKGNRVWVVNREHIHPNAKGGTINMIKLAMIHEYGLLDKGIPARPYWRLTRLQVEREFKQLLSAMTKEMRGKK